MQNSYMPDAHPVNKTNMSDTHSRNLYQKLALNRTQLYFLYQKLSNTADQSNWTIFVKCIGTSFLCKFIECVSPLQSTEVVVTVSDGIILCCLSVHS